MKPGSELKQSGRVEPTPLVMICFYLLACYLIQSWEKPNQAGWENRCSERLDSVLPQVYTANTTKKWQSSAWLVLKSMFRMLCETRCPSTHSLQGIALLRREGREPSQCCCCYCISSHLRGNPVWGLQNWQAYIHCCAAPVPGKKENVRGSWAHEYKPFFVLGAFGIMHIQPVHLAIKKGNVVFL